MGDEEDPTITTSLGSGPRGRGGRGGSQGQAEGEGSGQEELVVVIAGGMTSQLTYDGVDVCASRVAWEVSAGVGHASGFAIGALLTQGRPRDRKDRNAGSECDSVQRGMSSCPT